MYSANGAVMRRQVSQPARRSGADDGVTRSTPPGHHLVTPPPGAACDGRGLSEKEEERRDHDRDRAAPEAAHGTAGCRAARGAIAPPGPGGDASAARRPGAGRPAGSAREALPAASSLAGGGRVPALRGDQPPALARVAEPVELLRVPLPVQRDCGDALPRVASRRLEVARRRPPDDRARRDLRERAPSHP